ncbi:MAG TPA: tyrosine-protein phosphatase [Candidatus Sulfotelmatobacter sp.]
MKSRIHFVSAAAFVLLLSSALCWSAVPYQVDKTIPSPAEPAMGTRLHARGVLNFAEVTPGLYRGAQPSREGLEALKNLGINLIVDLRGSASKDEEATAKKLGMQYVSIPSHCPFPKDEPFAKFLRVIRENPAKKVFVHCRLGDDRTGMAVASYRMAEEGWSAEEAMKEMRTFGFSAVHHAMCPGLADYEESFPQRLKNDRAFKELQPYGAAATTK